MKDHREIPEKATRLPVADPVARRLQAV